MKKNNFNKKTLVMLTIFIIISVCVYPAIGVNSKFEDISINGKYKLDEKPKEYLLQTIVDILNQPEFGFNSEGTINFFDIINLDYDVREMSKNIFKNNPLIFVSIFLSTPEFRVSYLENQYNIGNEIKKIISQEKADLFMSSIEIKNNKFFNDLNDLIENNDYLYNRFITLQELNSNINDDIAQENSSILCDILQLLLIGYLIRCGFIGFFGEIFEGSLISKIFDFLWFKNWELAGVCLFIYDLFDCDLRN